MLTLNKRLELSNEEIETAKFIIHHREDRIGHPPIRYCMDLHNDSMGKEPKICDRIAELLRYRGEADLLSEFLSWTPLHFPVSGRDLFSKNVPIGPVFLKTITALRQIWKESNYSMSKEELVNKIEEIVKLHTEK